MRILAPLAFSALLTACASYQDIGSDWHQALPPVDIFVAAYESDDENAQIQAIEVYLLWVKRFYQGWALYENGWLKMSDDLARRIKDPAERRAAAAKIRRIGLLVAPEWAKEKDSRYITTSMIVVWGESLLESLDRGNPLRLMDAVLTDIDLLEGGQLDVEDISVERYFPSTATFNQEEFLY